MGVWGRQHLRFIGLPGVALVECHRVVSTGGQDDFVVVKASDEVVVLGQFFGFTGEGVPGCP